MCLICARKNDKGVHVCLGYCKCGCGKSHWWCDTKKMNKWLDCSKWEKEEDKKSILIQNFLIKAEKQKVIEELGRIDLSICPTLICPLSTYDSNSYKVRTLLDSGSSTNWIASEILPHIKYEIIGSKVLTVNTFSGRIRKRFKLIEAYFQYKLPPIRCFVMDTFSEAQIIKCLDWKIKKTCKN